MKLNLYSISDKYIQYLRSFDSRVYDNKEGRRTHTRKYLGVVFKIRNFNYYAPVSSPKNSDYYDVEWLKIKKSIIPIIRIIDKDKYGNYKLYGTIRISNMIPVPMSEIRPYSIKQEKDKKYKDLILAEIEFIRKNSDMIVKNANVLYRQKEEKRDIKYLKNTVDFKFLEEKCLEYINLKDY